MGGLGLDAENQLSCCVVYVGGHQGDDGGGVFKRRDGGVSGDGCVIDGGHREADGGDARVQTAIAHSIGEAVAAKVVFAALVVESTVGVHGQRAVQRTGDDGGAQKRAVDVGCCSQQVAVEQRVFSHCQGLAAQGRRIVDRRNCNAHSGSVADQAAVADRVGKAVAAVVVGCRGVAVAAVQVAYQAAMRRRGLNAKYKFCRGIVGIKSY